MMEDDKIAQICAFGFSPELAVTALQSFPHSIDAALNWLLDQGKELGSRPKQDAPPPRKKKVVKLDWMHWETTTRLTIYASALAKCAGLCGRRVQRELKAEFLHMMGVNDDYTDRNSRLQQQMDELPTAQQQRLQAALLESYANGDALVKAFKSLKRPAAAAGGRALAASTLAAQAPAADGNGAKDVAHTENQQPKAANGACEVVIKVVEGGKAPATAAGAVAGEVAAPIPAAIRSAVCTTMLLQHGIQQEGAVREAIERREKVHIHTPGRFRASAKAVCKVPVAPAGFEVLGFKTSERSEGVAVFIGGKCDGVIREEQAGREGKAVEIVEIKNRLKRLRGLQLHEVVQVHAYMHVWATPQARLVERHNDDVVSHPVAWNSTVWELVVAGVQAFVRDLLETYNLKIAEQLSLKPAARASSPPPRRPVISLVSPDREKTPPRDENSPSPPGARPPARAALAAQTAPLQSSNQDETSREGVLPPRSLSTALTEAHPAADGSLQTLVPANAPAGREDEGRAQVCGIKRSVPGPNRAAAKRQSMGWPPRHVVDAADGPPHSAASAAATPGAVCSAVQATTAGLSCDQALQLRRPQEP